MINVERNITIKGSGISIGSITDSSRLIEHIIENKKIKNSKNTANEALSALEEAVGNVPVDASVTLYTDRSFDSYELLGASISKIVKIAKTFQVSHAEDMLAKAVWDLQNEESEYAVLLASTKVPEPGYVVVVLGAANDAEAEIQLLEEKQIDTKAKEEYFVGADETFRVLTNILCASIEVTAKIRLLPNQPQEQIRYLWKTNDIRCCTVSVGEKSNRIVLIKQPVKKEKGKLRVTQYLIPVSFLDGKEFDSELKILKDRLLSSMEDLAIICMDYIQKFLKENGDKQTISFVQKDVDGFLSEISKVESEREHFLKEGYQWETPSGSFFIARDHRQPAKIVCMNSPGGMVKKGAFYRTYAKFEALEDIDKENLFSLSVDSNKMISEYLYEADMNQSSLGILKQLGITSEILAGASMGEISMFCSKKVLASKREGLSSEELEKGLLEVLRLISEVFNRQEELAEDYFKKPIKFLDKWYLKCSVDKVRQAIEEEDEVFLFIIGSPEDVIISGETEACLRVVRKLGCVSSKINEPSFVHTPVLEPAMPAVMEGLEEIQEYIRGVDFDIYSTYYRRPFDDSCEMFNENIRYVLTKTVNFMGVVERIYADSGKIFFDLSSGNLCGVWVNNCLAGRKDYKVLSLYEQSSCEDNILKIMAVLMSFHAKVDYNQFLSKVSFPARSIEENTNCSSLDTMEFYQSCIKQQLHNNSKAFQLYLKNQEQLLQQMLEGPLTAKKNYLYDRDEIVHMTDISMADILGEQYREADSYPVRARMPLPPFLFVSRILSIDAEFGVYRPSSIEMEYDIDENFPVRTGERSVSEVSLGEASHIGIFLCAYMGIDIMSKGKLKFRITNASATVIKPHTYCVGEVIRIIYRIDKFVKKGDTILVFCSYDKYMKDELLSTTKAIGGFFTKQDLEGATGINENAKAVEYAQANPMLHFTERPAGTYNDVQTHAFFLGDYRGCFGEDTGISLKDAMFRGKEAIFVDRVTDIQYDGGLYHSGYIRSEKMITPEFWPFRYHFKNDPVLPGTIMLEGLNQTAEFLFAHAGLLGRYKKSVIQMEPNQTYSNIFRGQVRNIVSKLTYELHIVESGEDEDGIYVKLCGDVTWDQMHVIHQEGIIYRIVSAD